jgi:hypothetical protein
MSNNTAATAATTATTAEPVGQSQQDCRLMRLPTELRLRIYKFAFQNIVNDITSDAAEYVSLQTKNDPDDFCAFRGPPSVRMRPVPYVGALALLHTNQDLRREGLDELLALARKHYNESTERNDAMRVEWDIVRHQHPRHQSATRVERRRDFPVRHLRWVANWEAWYRWREMRMILSTVRIARGEFIRRHWNPGNCEGCHSWSRQCKYELAMIPKQKLLRHD